MKVGAGLARPEALEGSLPLTTIVLDNTII